MKNINQPHIEKLQNLIYSTLDPLIDSNYSLIDIPDHNNIGDNLIWQGELDYLSRLNYKMLYETNCWIYRDKDLPINGIILLHGGGNFGDLYIEPHKIKLHIIKKYTNRKIIIFPQSIHYNNEKNFKNDLEIFLNHPNLHICVRDKESYDLLTSNGLINIYLVPDMAFCIDLDKLNTNSLPSQDKLLMKRKDKELETNNILNQIIEDNPKIEILDWPTFNVSKNKHRLVYRKERYNRIISTKLLDIPLLNNLIDSRYGLKSRKQKEKYIDLGIEFLNKYNTIYTTRLHGVILAVLLDKNIIIIDNKHKKLTRFYNTWLKDFKNVKIY